MPAPASTAVRNIVLFHGLEEFHLLAPEKKICMASKNNLQEQTYTIVPPEFVAALARRSSTADGLSGLIAALISLFSGVRGGGKAAAAAAAEAVASFRPRKGLSQPEGLPGFDTYSWSALLR